MRSSLASLLVLALSACAPARCDTAADCPGERHACSDGVCDVACAADAECRADARCDHARCVAREACEVDGDCPEILVCTGDAFPSCTSFARGCRADGLCE